MKRIDLTGQKFGKLTVIGEGPKIPGNQNRRWECLCDCGSRCVVFGVNLRTGHTASCGCTVSEILHKRNHKHGQTHTRLYRIWCHLKGRCNNPTDKAYKDYGGRGIMVCREWNDDFESFRDWSLENGYRYDLTLDRIDNDGPYAPANCRWASGEVQANNMRSNRKYTVDGITKTQREWEIAIGAYRGALWKIHSSGRSVEEYIRERMKKT